MELITVKYDDRKKTVGLNDFVRQSKVMLKEFGLRANEKEIREQIENVRNGRALNVIGVFLQDYIDAERS